MFHCFVFILVIVSSKHYFSIRNTLAHIIHFQLIGILQNLQNSVVNQVNYESSKYVTIYSIKINVKTRSLSSAVFSFPILSEFRFAGPEF